MLSLTADNFRYGAASNDMEAGGVRVERRMPDLGHTAILAEMPGSRVLCGPSSSSRRWQKRMRSLFEFFPAVQAVTH